MHVRCIRLSLTHAHTCHVFLQQCSGVSSVLLADGMTRAPVVRFPSAVRAGEAKRWLEVGDNFDLLKDAFDQTSRSVRQTGQAVSQSSESMCRRISTQMVFTTITYTSIVKFLP